MRELIGEVKMSGLKDLIINNRYCDTADMRSFVEKIDSTISLFPENLRKIVDEDLVKVFEKGLVLGLHHFLVDDEKDDTNEFED